MLVLFIIMCGQTRAQERITVAADVLLYGDNTEFRNPFREGETLFGAAPRVSMLFDFNARTSLQLGIFANTRFGGNRASELTRPIVALKIRGARSSFIFGTLNTPRVAEHGLARRSLGGGGPDRTGPHGLLPPLQVETLAFERPYENGFQWLVNRDRVRHDAWLSWQRLNTPEHRERFNAGINTELDSSGWFTIPLQLHVVHEGGQQFASGPVADSVAAAAGAVLHRRFGHWAGRAELLGLRSRYVPDRERAERSRTGTGAFARASVEDDAWRAHMLFWRGRDFVKVEGDPNYLSLRRTGSLYGGTRDYAEAGVTRLFRPAPQVRLEVSARMHRVERQYEYSYRVVAVTAARFTLKGRP